MESSVLAMLYWALPLAGLLLFLYVRKCAAFWRSRGVPSGQPSFLFGHIGKLLLGLRPAALVYEDVYRSFPEQPFVGFYEFLKPNLLVRDPRLIQAILVKDFSHFTDRVWLQDGNHPLGKGLFFMKSGHWKELRGRMVTSFSAAKMKSMCSMMNRCADTLDSVLSQKCQDEAVDVKESLARYAADMIGCCAFGLNFNALIESESECLKFGQKIFENSLSNCLIDVWRSIAPDSCYFWSKFIQPPQMFLKFYNMIKQAEELRKKEPSRRNDLMQLLLDFRDECQQRSLKEDYNGVMVDDAVVLSNMIGIYVASFETVSAVLSYVLYELALHPDIQQRLRSEVKSILANTEEVTYNEIKQMAYAEMVVSETLRKDASAPLIRRACTSPYQLPGTSLTLSAGQLISISVYSMHRDEKYYPNPEIFDPERFTPENIASRPPYTYLPFGDGPRMCIAMRFAKMSLKLLLARILSKYEIKPCSKTEIPVKIHPRSTGTSPINPILLQIQKL